MIRDFEEFVEKTKNYSEKVDARHEDMMGPYIGVRGSLTTKEEDEMIEYVEREFKLIRMDGNNVDHRVAFHKFVGSLPASNEEKRVKWMNGMRTAMRDNEYEVLAADQGALIDAFTTIAAEKGWNVHFVKGKPIMHYSFSPSHGWDGYIWGRTYEDTMNWDFERLRDFTLAKQPKN